MTLKKQIVGLFSIFFMAAMTATGGAQSVTTAAGGTQSFWSRRYQHPSGAEWKPFHAPENPTLRVVVDPGARATFNQEFTWELEWRPERYVYAGTEIELQSLNLNTYLNWRYTRIEIPGADVTFRRPITMTPSQVFANFGKYVIARARLRYTLRLGTPLRIRLTAIPPFTAGQFDAVRLSYAEPTRGSSPEAQSPEFVSDPRAEAVLGVAPAHVERLMIYSHPMPGADGKVRTTLVPIDRFANPTKFERPVPVRLDWNGKSWVQDLQASKVIELDPPQAIGRLTATIQAKMLSPADNIANASREGGSLVVTGNPVWRTSPDGQLAAFGEFHWHTEISPDGTRALPVGLTYARDDLNLDYTSPSDHTPRGAKWGYTVSVLNSFNKPDQFATFFGWEHSTSRGHENYYFTDPNHPLSPVGKIGSTLDDDDLTQLPKTLAAYDTPGDRFMAVPHHTNAVGETRRLSDGAPYWFPYPWTTPDIYHRLVEIFQVRGNQERNYFPDDAWRGWYANGSSVQDALARGYKLGFTGGSDNHVSMPGHAFDYGESMGRVPPDSISLTGLWTHRIERQAVFDALYARHTWADWDTRSIVYFSVNGSASGDELSVKKGEALVARIKMSTDDTLRSMEIVSEGKTVWSGTPDDMDFDLKIQLPHATHSTWFYLRALLRDGGIVYASPVFVTVK